MLTRVATSSRGKPTDVRVASAAMYLLPVAIRMPLKFGAETLTHIDCVRVRMTVRDDQGRTAQGWGETPLSVQWAWPSRLAYQPRRDSMVDFCQRLTRAWPEFSAAGHPIEIGHDLLRNVLPTLCAEYNASAELIHAAGEPLPYLASLICASALDIALHDAFGNLHGVDIYNTYNANFMNRDLSAFLEADGLRPASEVSRNGSPISFAGRYPEEFFAHQKPQRLAAWHLVGGLDPLEPAELNGEEPSDGVPVLLGDWIST